MDRRSRVDKTIKRVASKAAATGKTPNVTEMAIRISSHNPQSGLTLSQIEESLNREVEANRKSES